MAEHIAGRAPRAISDWCTLDPPEDSWAFLPKPSALGVHVHGVKRRQFLKYEETTEVPEFGHGASVRYALPEKTNEGTEWRVPHLARGFRT